MGTRILLEGRPGAGKTTVVRRLVDLLKAKEVPVKGFLTEEIREGGRRVGFAIEDLAGNRSILAHIDFRSDVRVGRYRVDVDAFERIATPALRDVSPNDKVVIDELGKMELSSGAFREIVEELFNGRASIVATVHVFRHPVTDALKARADVQVKRIGPSNRENLPRELLELLMA
jgi:nucleoside-triphosphatase